MRPEKFMFVKYTDPQLHFYLRIRSVATPLPRTFGSTPTIRMLKNFSVFSSSYICLFFILSSWYIARIGLKFGSITWSRPWQKILILINCHKNLHLQGLVQIQLYSRHCSHKLQEHFHYCHTQICKEELTQSKNLYLQLTEKDVGEESVEQVCQHQGLN